MKGIISQSNDAAFNLATEEHLLKNRSEDIFFLYINSPSIIAGKHQNILAEINFKSAQKLNLNVYRRLSGGGTVYHDMGNLNFCFISNAQRGELINFRHYSTLIADSLAKLGLNPTIGTRNDIMLDGMKISGNASHVFRNRSLHHGTLLFNSNLTHLNDCLSNEGTKYQDKAVKSVKSVVTNITEHLTIKIEIEEFKHHIFNSITNSTESQISLKDNETLNINTLTNTKYNTWTWNYGYSPDYKLTRRININGNALDVNMTIQKGIIQNIIIENNSIDTQLQNLIQKTVGAPHEPSALTKILLDDIRNIYKIANPTEFINDFF